MSGKIELFFLSPHYSSCRINYIDYGNGIIAAEEVKHNASEREDVDTGN